MIIPQKKPLDQVIFFVNRCFFNAASGGRAFVHHLATRINFQRTSAMTRDVLHDEARLIDFAVSLADRCDRPLTSRLGGTEINEEYLIFSLVDDRGKLCLEEDFFSSAKIALEHGKLEVVPPIPARLKNFPQAFGIGNVVANDVSVAHGWDEGRVKGEG